MEKDSFEKLLQQKVLEADFQLDQGRDPEKVWAAIGKKSRAQKWPYARAAAVLLLMAWLFFPRPQIEKETQKVRREAIGERLASKVAETWELPEKSKLAEKSKLISKKQSSANKLFSPDRQKEPQKVLMREVEVIEPQMDSVKVAKGEPMLTAITAAAETTDEAITIAFKPGKSLPEDTGNIASRRKRISFDSLNENFARRDEGEKYKFKIRFNAKNQVQNEQSGNK